MNNDTAYHTYLTLHLLEEYSPELDDMTCDERWAEASAHYELWKRSSFNDTTLSHYECITEYALNL